LKFWLGCCKPRAAKLKNISRLEKIKVLLFAAFAKEIKFTNPKCIKMKKAILLIALITGAMTFAQSGAKLEFKNGGTIDFGTVSKDSDSGVRTIEFTNTGNAPLIITDVKSTCGCTVPSKPKEPIMPGKSDKIEVKYNMNPGPIRKTITIESNATNWPDGRVPLKVTGEVIVKEEVNPLQKKKSLMAK
jgi:hypothetical protein